MREIWDIKKIKESKKSVKPECTTGALLTKHFNSERWAVNK